MLESKNVTLFLAPNSPTEKARGKGKGKGKEVSVQDDRYALSEPEDVVKKSTYAATALT